MAALIRNPLFAPALALFFLLLLGWAWVGFLASDDVTYARGAYGWIEQFPYVGGHGTIRYTITLPMALSFLTLGGNAFAMVLPSLLYMFALLTIIWFGLRARLGVESANLALLMLATMPLIVVQTTIASVDIIELFFLSLSLIAFIRATEDGDRANLMLFVAGASAGFAFLTRETAIFVALFYGLLFLSGYRISRWRYWIIAGGFLAIWAIEIAYLWAMTGDPLYRFNISVNHDSTIDRSVDLAGNMIVHPVVDPLLVLLFNQEFMTLFWIAIPFASWLCFGKRIAAETQRLARLIALFGLVWFVACGAAWSLLPLNPRYFMPTSASAAILTGLGLWQLFQRGWHRSVLLLALFIVGTNMLGILVENKSPRFAEQQLAEIARNYDEPIHTDAETRYRSDMPLKWVDRRDMVVDTPPPPGALYYDNPAQSDGAGKPRADWRQVESFDAPPDAIIGLIELIGLDAVVPPAIWQRLRYRNPTVTLYRLPDA